jgi:TatD DNase family protein
VPLVDSHCHLDFPEFDADRGYVVARMAAAGVCGALCVSVSLEDFPRTLSLARSIDNICASVGVHPDHAGGEEPTVGRLVKLADDPKVVAIGETGLDYYRHSDIGETQRERFRRHIRAAREAGLPLIVHTRAAAEDTLRIMREERAEQAGGVMHCFTETWDVAEQAMDLGFVISVAGIVTFKNATSLRAVAERVPMDRLLVETDCPYLAPVPHRGRRNEPAYVGLVAEQIAALKHVNKEKIVEETSGNFFRTFPKATNWITGWSAASKQAPGDGSR